MFSLEKKNKILVISIIKEILLKIKKLLFFFLKKRDSETWSQIIKSYISGFKKIF